MTLSLVTAPVEEAPPIAEKRVCSVCGTEYEVAVHNQKYCSEKCRLGYYKTHVLKEYRQKYYRAHKEKIDKQSTLWAKKHRKRRREISAKSAAAPEQKLKKAKRQHIRTTALVEWIRGIKASFKCARCSEARSVCLDFHHLDGSNKEHAIAAMVSGAFSKEAILKETAKCIVLCRNCHAVEHWERRTEENL